MIFPYRYAALGLLLAVGGCDRNVFQSSPQALVLKGDPKACTHPATRALVEQIIRRASNRTVSADELVNVPVAFGSTLMASAEPGVNVSCHSDLVIGESITTTFAYIVVPSADNDQDIGIQWSDEMENYPYAMATYGAERSNWQRRLAEQSALVDNSRRSITDTANAIPAVATQPPAPPVTTRAPPQPAKTSPAPSLSNVPDPPRAEEVSTTPRARNGRDRDPSWARQALAQYPQAALASGRDLSAQVRLSCIARTDGRLTDCEILLENPTGYGFGEAAIAGTRRSRINPAIRNGEPAETRLVFDVRFAPEQD